MHAGIWNVCKLVSLQEFQVTCPSSMQIRKHFHTSLQAKFACWDIECLQACKLAGIPSHMPSSMQIRKHFHTSLQAKLACWDMECLQACKLAGDPSHMPSSMQIRKYFHNSLQAKLAMHGIWNACKLVQACRSSKSHALKYADKETISYQSEIYTFMLGNRMLASLYVMGYRNACKFLSLQEFQVTCPQVCR